MYSILPTITNLLQYISILTPFILVFFFLLASVMVGDVLSLIPVIKNAIYIFGGIIITGIVIIIQNMLNSKQDISCNKICNILPFPFTNLNENNKFLISPFLNSSILGYTLGYIFIPNINNNINYIALAVFLILLIVNSITELLNKCTNIIGIISGLLIGILFGLFLNNIIPDKRIKFHKEILNSRCGESKKGETKYKCKYYKDGVEINLTNRNHIYSKLMNIKFENEFGYKLNKSFNIPANINEFGVYELYNQELSTKYQGDEKGLKLYLEKKANETAIKNNSPFYISVRDFYIYIPVINGASLSNIDNLAPPEIFKIPIEYLDQFKKDIQNPSSGLKIFVKS